MWGSTGRGGHPPFPGWQIDRDEALPKQTVPRTMTAVVVAGRQLHRQVRGAEVLVDPDLSPRAGVAGVGPRILLPGGRAPIAGQRSRAADPERPSPSHAENAGAAILAVAAL